MLRGRCNSEPAVTVRDPTAASGRLTGWNSQTDGESPDGRQHAAAGPVGSQCGTCRPCVLGLVSRLACTPPELNRHGFERKGSTVAEHRHADTAMMRRALALAAHGPPGQPQPPRRLRPRWTPTVTSWPQGWHRGAGTPHAEADALAAAGERARRVPRPSSPSSRATTPAAPGRAPRRCIAAGVAAWSTPRPTPTRPRPAAPSGCARRGRRGRGRPAGRRGAGAQPRPGPTRDHRPPVGDLEVRDHPRRPQRRGRRDQPVDHRRGRPRRRPRAAVALRRDARRHRHRAASTTRS